MKTDSVPMIEPNNQPMTQSPSEERGATLVEYALMLSLVILAIVVAVDLLGDTGGNLLNASSTEIGTPRESREVVLDAPLTAPPVWASTTIPPSILTWSDRPIATTDGCLSVVGSSLEIASCDSPNATPLNGLSNDGQITTISVVDGSVCLTGDNSGPSPTVSMQPCGGGGQDWRETSNSGANITFQNEATGLCLVPATPGALTMSACNGTNSVQVQF